MANEVETKEQLKAALDMSLAISEAIRGLGSVPSGHLYARLCDKMSLNTYESIIAMLVRVGVVRKDPSHLLVWTGPALESK